MARMTQAQAKQQGGNAANIEAINGKSVADITQQNYTVRRLELRTLAVQHMPSDVMVQDPKVREVFVEAFVDAGLQKWTSKLKRLEAERREWKQLLAAQTHEQLVAKMADYVRTFPIRGLNVDSGYGSVRVRIKRAWGIECDIDFSFERNYEAERVVNPDDATQYGGYYVAKPTKLSWGGTSHTLSHATACATMYREAIELAAEIEAVFEGERAAWTLGIPEPTEQQPSEQPSEPSNVQLTDVAS